MYQGRPELIPVFQICTALQLFWLRCDHIDDPVCRLVHFSVDILSKKLESVLPCVIKLVEVRFYLLKPLHSNVFC